MLIRVGMSHVRGYNNDSDNRGAIHIGRSALKVRGFILLPREVGNNLVINLHQQTCVTVTQTPPPPPRTSWCRKTPTNIRGTPNCLGAVSFHDNNSGTM